MPILSEFFSFVKYNLKRDKVMSMPKRYRLSLSFEELPPSSVLRKYRNLNSKNGKPSECDLQPAPELHRQCLELDIAVHPLAEATE